MDDSTGGIVRPAWSDIAVRPTAFTTGRGVPMLRADAGTALRLLSSGVFAAIVVDRIASDPASPTLAWLGGTMLLLAIVLVSVVAGVRLRLRAALRELHGRSGPDSVVHASVLTGFGVADLLRTGGAGGRSGRLSIIRFDPTGLVVWSVRDTRHPSARIPWDRILAVGDDGIRAREIILSAVPPGPGIAVVSIGLVDTRPWRIVPSRRFVSSAVAAAQEAWNARSASTDPESDGRGNRI